MSHFVGRKGTITARSHASSVVLNNTYLWITGGYDANFDHLQTTEYVSIDGKESSLGPPLPHINADHCMVMANASHAFLMGGHYCKQDTYYFDTTNPNALWTSGPQALHGRAGHGCASTDTGLVIVGGGFGTSDCSTVVDTVDILVGGQWTQGNKLNRHQTYRFCVPTVFLVCVKQRKI